MDPSRVEQIKRWAKYVRESNGAWKKPHALFINAQIQKANAFWQRLAQQPGGKEIVKKRFGVKNLDAMPFLK